MRLRAIALLVVGAVAAAVAAVVILGGSGPQPPVRPPSAETEFVPSVPGERAVLWAVGDGADGSDRAKRVVRRIRAGRVDRLLYLGDVYGGGGILGLVVDDGTAEDFEEYYATVYGALGARTAPTPGNHEWPQRADGYDPYWTRVHGSAPAYYAFDAGAWRILSLNTEAAHGPQSPQLRWLRAQLRTPGTCRLVFWHRPRFSAGRHGDHDDLAPLWEAVEGRAPLVLSGHDHNMQRLRPIGGTVQIISGAGGHGLYRVRDDPRLAFGNDTDYGALRVELRPGRADLAFVAADGRVLDAHRVSCRPG